MTNDLRAFVRELRLLDNPLARAEATRRLRRRQAVPLAILVGLVCLCGLLAVVAAGPEPGTWEVLRNFLVGGIAVLALLAAPVEVATTVADERSTGLLDFHRATPLGPRALLAGYFLGVPARSALFIAVALPFLVVAASLSGGTWGTTLLALVLIALSSVFYLSWAVLVALSRPKRRDAVLLVALPVAFGVPAAASGGLPTVLACLTPAPAVFALYGAEPAAITFFGMSWSVLLQTVVSQVFLIAFLIHGCVRKLRIDGAGTLSRAGAVGFTIGFLLLGLGGSWRELTGTGDIRAWAVFYALASVLLAVAVLVLQTPTRLAWVRSLRRSRRAGLATIPWRDEGARTWPLAGALFVVVVVSWSPLLLFGDVQGLADFRKPLALWTLPGLAAVLAFAAAAAEHVRLSHRSGSGAAALLVGFVAVVLPLLVSLILGLANAAPEASIYAMALSPAYALVAALLLPLAGGLDAPVTGPFVVSLSSAAAGVLLLGSRVDRALAETRAGLRLPEAGAGRDPGA